jgi:hypothetical protein
MCEILIYTFTDLVLVPILVFRRHLN